MIDNTKPRIANVGFLNSIPYRAASASEWLRYEECEPAECARKLHEDECDVGCIPIAEYLAHGDYQLLRYGIAAIGAVESVLVLSQRPLPELSAIYVDSGAQTSAVLLRLMLHSRRSEFIELPKIFRMQRDLGLLRAENTHGIMIIGDSALVNREKFPFVIDLAAWWNKETGLPMVFAGWSARKNRLSAEQIQSLEELFQHGIDNREFYAREWADENKFDREFAERYVRESIHYQLSADILQGLREFAVRGIAAGIFPSSCLAKLPKETERHTLTDRNGSPILRIHKDSDVDSILVSASEGGRISITDALRLAEEATLADLSLATTARRGKTVKTDDVSYIVDRNINYTNVCNVYCRFCAFYRAPGKKDGYTLSREEIGKKIQETVDAGGVQILLQGGLNPELGIEYYEDLFRWIKDTYPINLHALSADEIMHISRVSHLSYEEVFKRLIAAGLGSFPGGGAEILVDRVRHRIARLKSKAGEWLEVHRTAHRLGLRSSCTMMFGVQESWEDRILHLHKLRQLQDETHGFTAFICWPFQEDNTHLKAGDTSAPEYLRMQAVGRLFLDNIPNVQSSWVTQGPSIGQIALHFGANDFGSVMFEENVVSAAGTTYQMTADYIERHILESGFRPWRRNVLYGTAEEAVIPPSF